MKSLLALPCLNFPTLSIPLSTIMGWLAAISLLTFTISLLLLPLLIKRIPSDYFVNLAKSNQQQFKPTPFQISVLLIRNVFGAALLIAGIAMLFLPGQGLITIFLSLLLMTFPGKKKLTSRFIKDKKFRNSINWLRKKVHGDPIIWP